MANTFPVTDLSASWRSIVSINPRRVSIMESIQTHPSTAAQAKAFTAPGSFAFPTGHHDVGSQPVDAKPNGQAPAANGNQPTNGAGVMPATPAATPAAAPGASGLTPTLQ